MRSLNVSLLILAFAWFASPSQVQAQRGMGDPSGVGQQAVKPSLTTLSGTLMEIKTEPCEKTTGRSPLGTHLIIKDDGGKAYNVHLGPAALVADSVKRLSIGQRITARAFRTDKLPAQHYIAQSLVSGKNEFVFRDANLRPVWAGPWAGRTPTSPPAPNSQTGESLKQDVVPPTPMTRRPGVVPPWAGRGPWRGGRGQDARFQADRDVFHGLLAAHERINRTVTRRLDGVETVTESEDPSVALAIQDHANAMHERLQKGMPIHMRDPLFAALFAKADKIKLEITKTDKGVRVVETSDDPYVAKLIQAHADVVTKFVKNGFPEAWQNHPVPDK